MHIWIAKKKKKKRKGYEGDLGREENVEACKDIAHTEDCNWHGLSGDKGSACKKVKLKVPDHERSCPLLMSSSWLFF
jgi:hypothetical protein